MIKTQAHRSEWWASLSSDWKKAFNEAMLGNGPIENSPADADIQELFECPNFRFAGPRAFHANMSFELTDLSGLESMLQAEMIAVTFHQLVSLQPISHLQRLSALFVDNNRIISIDGIESMTKLKILAFTANEIESLLPLMHLTEMENLQVAYNQLKSFEGLTETNTKRMQQFVGLPNRVSQLEIERIQNELKLKVIKS